MARVLVTGGAGFIGSHLVDRLVENKHEVFVIDDYSGGDSKYHDDRVWYSGSCDLRLGKTADSLIEKIRPEIIFHLAANAAENKAQFSPIDITSRNYSAFINTFTPAIKYGVKRFVFTSSIAVYGSIQTPFYEVDKPEPEDLYGISKLACEQSLKVMGNVHGIEYVIARPHNVYGPRQNMTDPYRNVVTIWMNAILKGAPYYIYGDGSMRRCFSYIDDVVDALYKCGFDDVAGRTFNIGADTHYSLLELSDTLQKVIGRPYKPVFLDKRPQEVAEAIADHTLAKELLSYKDKTRLLEGLSKTWEWVQEQGYQEPKYTDFEIHSEKIPMNWRTQL